MAYFLASNQGFVNYFRKFTIDSPDRRQAVIWTNAVSKIASDGNMLLV